jgi:3-keto-disaccharide hydrolase
MRASEMTRRAFAGTVAAAGFCLAQDGWIDLFDGRSLQGWRPSENKNSWKVVGGQLLADGPRSHLFYDGPVREASFKNFELEVEALAYPAANSGIYFHTTYQETGYPRKGFEVQINNTATGEGGYRERKKTGSLYGVRNVYKQLVADDEWFKIHVAVRDKSIQVRLNGILLVDFTEFTPPFIAAGNERERFLDRGTFALQGHDPGSKVRFRRIRVRPLPDDVPTPGPVAAAADALERDIITLGARNIPLVDYHVHLKAGLTLEQALAKSRRDGIQHGIAINCGPGFPVQDDDSARRFVDEMKGQPVFLAMQAEGREWTRMFSRRAAALFDYVFTDSMTWTDNRGRRMRLWIPEEVGTIPNPREFMDTLVERTIGILENEPVDIYVNPTFLPKPLDGDYDRLWTDERMRKVAGAAARNNIAIEINDRFKLPSSAFLRVAKEEGCKFALGTNNGGPADLGRCEYGIRMATELKLSWQDFFVPGAWGPKAVERKPGALRA